jgi:hypothetical protein
MEFSPGLFSSSLCDEGGIPVISSSLDLSWPMVHEGEMRRSDPAVSDVTWMGMSAAVWRLIFE